MKSTLEAVDYQILHDIPGRLRVKVPAVKEDPKYAERLRHLVLMVPEVTTVRISETSGSVVVSYDTNPKNRQQRIQQTLVSCIQEARSTAATAHPVDRDPSLAVSAISVESESSAVAPVTSDPSATTVLAETTTEPIASDIARIESDVLDIFETLGIPLPEGYVFDFSQIPFEIDQQRKVVQIGMPVILLLQVLNAELDKFELENEKNTDVEQIHLDLDLTSVENGLLLQGKAKGQFRKRLFSNPLTKRKHYTPWVSLSAVGQAELIASVVDEALQFEMRELTVSGDPGEWHEELVKYAFEYLFKDKLVGKINQALSNYNGAKLQNLFFQSQDGKNFLTKAQKIGLTRDRIDALLALFEINARLTDDYLWLSIQF